ncbi:MAG: beta-ketoacyl synthase N-terminal-like domain-containing protein [Bacteroidota bacterium]
MQTPIYISSIATISALGSQSNEIWANLKNQEHLFSKVNNEWVSKLSEEQNESIQLIKQDPQYRYLDRTVLLALDCSRRALERANWSKGSNFGINIGSSRGATELFENYYSDFKSNKMVSPLCSPSTTLGNISSWVAHDLKSKGPEISHSITCSTALHAILNGIAWITSGLADRFMAGGSEAPLTDFTIGQMKALKIYSKEESNYPCRALDTNKTRNSMILSEGAGMVCLQSKAPKKPLGKIIGIGYATEPLIHGASLSSNAQCIQEAMTMALGTHKKEQIDAVITHTPGTVKGDQAEIEALNSIFCNKIPALTTNKWIVGHSLGTSGLLSIEMALLMLEHQEFVNLPFFEQKTPLNLSKIMINAVGFGGNAVSILLTK